MSLRIRFVEPRPAGHNVYDHVLLPRLGLPLMATMLAESGHDTAVFCEMLGPIDLGECLAADLVGISGTTATQPAGYALADELSAAGVAVVLDVELHPGLPVLEVRAELRIAHGLLCQGPGDGLHVHVLGLVGSDGAFLGLVIVGVIWLVRELSGRGGRLGREPDALELLDRRLADGTISPDDYRERRAILAEPRSPGSEGQSGEG